ncbi:hypothetical protein Barb6_02943 [Bacteroidales bacterium Barb6]|nr:hypothetical protein Barb6_02943 [Bacteroidales bacterium Barb6]
MRKMKYEISRKEKKETEILYESPASSIRFGHQGGFIICLKILCDINSRNAQPHGKTFLNN